MATSEGGGGSLHILSWETTDPSTSKFTAILMVLDKIIAELGKWVPIVVELSNLDCVSNALTTLILNGFSKYS